VISSGAHGTSRRKENAKESGSAGDFCEEIVICTAARRDCGDDNRVKCR